MNKKLSLYDVQIVINNNSFSHLADYIDAACPSSIFVIVDSNTKTKCLPILLESVSELKNSCVIEICPGETSKSLQEVKNICEILLVNGLDRSSLIINLGGGVVCDLGGFVASIIKRGVNFINIPTTLMSQIDASIGGKVGVNFLNQKNQLGLFSNPQLIFISSVFLKTLSNKEISTSYSEIVKYALIFDKIFWHKLQKLLLNNKINLSPIIKKCINIKKTIVAQDFHDVNERRKLNFGHSIAHAIESCFIDNKLIISHGLAVFVGLICESYISYEKNNLSKVSLMEIVNFIFKLMSPIFLEKKYDEKILYYIKSDKKNKNGISRFTLLNSIGESVVNCHVSDVEVLNSFKFYRKNAKLYFTKNQ
ncbi:MAG: 3-dehydroquinate synthase [Flavobacteriales bacterium]|nr:3-dehydroquinate synthase [Flavobacteriales bacterium]|tara:strand:+ start:12360 stop:13454 length:1095 start_codon:yes stop_codon:yes gene_type:complete